MWRRRLLRLGFCVGPLSVQAVLSVPVGQAVVVVALADEECAELVRTLRQRSPVPVLVATGAGAERYAAEAVRHGATTFLPLPYDLDDLTAALDALAGRDVDEEVGVLRAGGLLLDPLRREVRHHGEPVHLPPREFDVLRLLLEHADRVVLVEDLLERCWGGRERTPLHANSLVVHVRRLRQRLGDDTRTPRLLISVRGLGYRLVAQDREPAGAR